MDVNSDEYQLKKLLVDLESQQEHLQVSVSHLVSEVEKREIEVRKLLVDRELSLAKRENATSQLVNKLTKSQSVDFDRTLRKADAGDSSPKFSSEYSKQVSELLDKITKTSEEVSELAKL